MNGKRVVGLSGLLVCLGVGQIACSSNGSDGGGVPPVIMPSVDPDTLNDDQLASTLMAEDQRDLDTDGAADTGTQPATDPPGDVDPDEDAWQEDASPIDPLWDDSVSPISSSSDFIGTTSSPLLNGNGTKPPKAFGLGVDVAAAVASPLYPQLAANWKQGAYGLRAARVVSGTTGALADQQKQLDPWLAAAASKGLEPMVGLSVSANGTRISHPAFRARFYRLLRAYAQVKQWGVTNEPDLELGGPSFAKEAVEYFIDGAQTLRFCLRNHKCSRAVRVVAGEFAYQGDSGSVPKWHEYRDEMVKHVHSKKNPSGRLRGVPTTWSLHPYRDTTEGTTNGTKSFLKFLGTFEHAGYAQKGMLRAWLTESGTLLAHGGATGTPVACSAPVGNGAAQRHGANAVHALANLGRVDRVYWWQWQEANIYWGGTWDSGMLATDGTPRESFCALAGDSVACTGDPWTKHCPSPQNGAAEGAACSPDRSPNGMFVEGKYCQAGLQCVYASGCGVTDGTCVRLAHDTKAAANACNGGASVCGCDGKHKFPSACAANAQGYSVGTCK